MTSEILFSSDSIRVEYFYAEQFNHKDLAFIFTPLTNRNLDGNHYGGDVFLEMVVTQ